MQKNIVLFYWIKNIFNFSKPYFSSIQYADCVFDNKAYLLIQWHYEKACQLTIKKIKYKSYHKKASAYLLLPDNIMELEIVVSNIWRKEKRNIIINRTALPIQIEYPVQPHFTSLNNKRITIADVKLKERPVNVENTELDINTPNLKTKNLTYP